MVTSTETPPSALVEVKKAIVIKLPFDLQERILAFPFVHKLKEKYPDSEIHFITPKMEVEVLNLLPYKAYYHEFDEDEISNIFDVHRYVVNVKIYKVDMFVSLTNSFSDACLGLALRAKERLGFANGWKTLLFNQKRLRPVGHHICEDFFALYKAHVGGEIETDKIKVKSRELEAVIDEWEAIPYIAINLSPIRGESIEEELIELVSHFEKQRIVFFASEEQEKVKTLIDSFIFKLPKTNQYVQFLLKDWIDRAKMMAFSQGVITYNGPAATVAAYTGAKTLVLYDRQDPQRYGPFYFESETMMMTTQEAVPTESLKPRITFDMGVVADKAHAFFKL